MQTAEITSEDLSASVIAVPPLCRAADLTIDREQNRRLIAHLEKGGVRTLLYGGNANLYNIAVSEYALLLELLRDEVKEDTLVIPSVGPFYGNIVDQAELLRDSGFPAAMVLPTLFPANPAGVATAVRHFVERARIKAILYIKDDAYITPELVAELVADGLVSCIKYAVVRKDPAHDDYLRDLIERVDRRMVVSGIGEQPAIVHMRDFGLVSFTSGCVCIAPSQSMRMLDCIKAKNFVEAEKIRATFSGLEDLRNTHGPIPVLHHAVALAEIAETGSLLPLMADLGNDLMGPIEGAAVALLKSSGV
ncbi:MAG: dihydrodipicolinate synthase family protein [Verrucomicrobiota bacterium]|nr:dihydrodipicolinate synthase family protein [Verrucomicrobiota bacterium]